MISTALCTMALRRTLRGIIPAFLYPNFTKINRDDVLAIRAWLATLAPVRNRPPPPQLRWPLNYRVVIRGWNLLFFTPGTFKPDPPKSDAWSRGAYLVEGAAHCGACHTPKNAFGADRRDRLYGGGLIDGGLRRASTMRHAVD